jgi:hypothetical protein
MGTLKKEIPFSLIDNSEAAIRRRLGYQESQRNRAKSEMKQNRRRGKDTEGNKEALEQRQAEMYYLRKELQRRRRRSGSGGI